MSTDPFPEPPIYGARQPVSGSTEGFLGRVRQANARFAPEESVALRVVVGVASMAAATAAVRQGVGGEAMGVAVVLGIPAAHVFSYVTRHREGMWIKGLLAMGILVAFANFLTGVAQIRSGVVTDVQIPLAQLFLWSQLGHSIDMPSRRDLLFSLMSSAVLVTVAGVLSISMTFSLHLAVWSVACVVALALAHRRELAVLPALAAEQDPPNEVPRVLRPALLVVALIIVLGTVAFMFVPPAGAARALTFPSRLPSPVRVPDPGGISNPSLGDDDPARQGENSTGDAGERQSFGYFGFSTSLDTSVRGRPDDSVVMRVRSSAPDFWRGQTFDVWDGRTWTISNETAKPVVGDRPLRIPDVDPRPVRASELVQTYYLEAFGPNLVFAAYRPKELYFPDNGVFQLDDGTLRSAVQIEDGAVYTVISERPAATPLTLGLGDDLPVSPRLLARYTQLPPMPERIGQLARDVTAAAPTTYDKVLALQDWMAENTKYTLDIPVPRRGADAVDQFLFVDRRGFCEQIGTSLVVLLRSLGIPARLAVGYAAGQRNPFTGLYEVKASDAHSWVEVWFPGISAWQGFDPTASVPLAGTGGPRAAGSGALRYLTKVIPAAIPPAAGRVVWLLAVVVGMGWGLVLLVSLGGRRRRDAARPWVIAFADQLEAAGRARGRSRARGQTVREYLEDLMGSVLPDRRLAEVGAIVEVEAFAGRPADPRARSRAEEILREVEAAWPSSRLSRSAPLRQ